MIRSWKKNAEVAHNARQRLEIDTHRIACHDNLLSTGIPPVTDRTIVRIAQTRVAVDTASGVMLGFMCAAAMAQKRGFVFV